MAIDFRDEAERLSGYWEQHGDDPEVVERGAMEDLRGLLRLIEREMGE